MNASESACIVQLTVEDLGNHHAHPAASCKVGVFVKARLEDFCLQLVQRLALDDALRAVSVLHFTRRGAWRPFGRLPLLHRRRFSAANGACSRCCVSFESVVVFHVEHAAERDELGQRSTRA